MVKIVDQTRIGAEAPAVQQQQHQQQGQHTEFDISMMANQNNVANDNAGVEKESKREKKASIWNKIFCCLGGGGGDKVGDEENKGLPLSRQEKREKKQLQKEEKALREKEKQKELSQKEWSTYTTPEKVKFILSTIFKVPRQKHYINSVYE